MNSFGEILYNSPVSRDVPRPAGAYPAIGYARHRLFQQNPAHPGVSFKKVDEQENIYSARVGIGYRALGQMVDADIVWFWIGPHSEYDKLL